MQKEFESMEDYWQKKLEEERSFYEAQLKMSDSIFKDLERKMKETEILIDIKETSQICFGTFCGTMLVIPGLLWTPEVTPT